jgi:hypothetical protein
MDMNPCNKGAFRRFDILMREGFCRAGRFLEHQRYGSSSRVVSEKKIGIETS